MEGRNSKRHIKVGLVNLKRVGTEREREREREREGAVLARQVLVSFGLVQWEGGRDEEEGEYENDVALASLALWP